MSTSITLPQTHPRPHQYADLLTPGVLRPFVLVTGLFFLWGVPNNLNDVLIRQFMKSFAITRFQAGLVQSAFYLGYFLLALPAGMLVKRKGYKAGFLTGLLLFSTGCFLFLPAAHIASYSAFLTALFVMASGLAFLETSANPFITRLGPLETSEERLNLVQAFNPVGSIVGVLIGTAFIFSGVELQRDQILQMQTLGTYSAYLHKEVLRVVMPYLLLGGLALLWALLIAVTRMPSVADHVETPNIDGNWHQLFRNRRFLAAVVAQFMYVGCQVGTWSYFIQYAIEYGHVTERIAGLLLTSTLLAFGLGRFVSASIMRRIQPARLMGTYATINIALLLCGVLYPGRMGLLAILTTSLFMSIMFPTIFALGLRGLGGNTNLGGSCLVMAIIGGAVLTPLMGILAERTHATAIAYVIPMLGYAVVAYYARTQVAEKARDG